MLENAHKGAVERLCRDALWGSSVGRVLASQGGQHELSARVQRPSRKVQLCTALGSRDSFGQSAYSTGEFHTSERLCVKSKVGSSYLRSIQSLYTQLSYTRKPIK